MKQLILRQLKPYLTAFLALGALTALFTLLVLFALPASAFRLLLLFLALLTGGALILAPFIIALVLFVQLLYRPYGNYELTLPLTPQSQLFLRFGFALVFVLLGAAVFLPCALALLPLIDLMPVLGVSAEDILSVVYAYLSFEPILIFEAVLLLLLMLSFELAFLYFLCASGQHFPMLRGAMPFLVYLFCTVVVFPLLTDYLLLPVFFYIGAWSMPFAGLAAVLFFGLVDAALLYFVYMTLSRRIDVK